MRGDTCRNMCACAVVKVKKMHFCQASSARARPCVGRHLRPYGTGYFTAPWARARRRCGLRGAETGETGRECSKCFKPRGATKQNRRVVSRHSAPPHTGPPVTPHVTPHPYVTRRAASGPDTRWRRDARHDRASRVSDTSHDTTPHSTRRHVTPHHETSRGHSSRHTTRLVEAPSPCARRPSLKILHASLPCPSPSERGPASDTVLRATRRLLLVAGSPRYRARRPAVCTPPRRGG
jgi:hypothetical protein